MNDMQYLYLFLIQKTFLVLDVNASEDERKQFVEQMMPRLDYQAFRTASLIVNQAPSAESSKELPPTELPKELPAEWDKDSKFLSSVWLTLNEFKQLFPLGLFLTCWCGNSGG
jgi:hypothetical protein